MAELATTPTHIACHIGPMMVLCWLTSWHRSGMPELDQHRSG